MSPTIKKILRIALIAFLGIGMLWLVFKDQDPDELLLIIKQADYRWIGLGILISLLSHLLRAVRWRQLLEPLGNRSTVKKTFSAVMVGYLVNYAIPRAGEVARCALLMRTDKIPVEKSLGTVVLERIFDFIILGLLVMATFIFQFDLIMEIYERLKGNSSSGSGQTSIIKYILLAGVLLGGIVLALFFIFRNKIKSTAIYIKIETMLLGFWTGMKSISQVKNKLLFIFYSLGIWFCYLMMMYFSFKGLHATEALGMNEALLVLVASTFGMVMPVPGGTGPFHYFTRESLILFGVSAIDGTSYATIVHGAQLLMFATVGSICFLILRSEEKKTNELSGAHQA